MSELVIEIQETGKVEALHMDGFDLGFLGDKKVFRQTDIVFCEETQKWDLVYLVAGASGFYADELTGFVSYEVARRFEVSWINDCRLQGIDPVSDEGLAVMRDMRERAHDKPEGPENVLVKSTFGCEHHKSVFVAHTG